MRLVPYVSKHHISPAVCVCTEFVVVSEQVSPQAGRGLCLHMSKRFTETAKWADPWFRALTAKHCAAFLRYANRLPRVMSAFAVRDAFQRVGPTLTGQPEWARWFEANSVLFQTN